MRAVTVAESGPTPRWSRPSGRRPPSSSSRSPSSSPRRARSGRTSSTAPRTNPSKSSGRSDSRLLFLSFLHDEVPYASGNVFGFDNTKYLWKRVHSRYFVSVFNTFQGLNACDSYGVLGGAALPKGIKSIGPYINDATTIQALATALHVTPQPITGLFLFILFNLCVSTRTQLLFLSRSNRTQGDHHSKPRCFLKSRTASSAGGQRRRRRYKKARGKSEQGEEKIARSSSDLCNVSSVSNNKRRVWFFKCIFNLTITTVFGLLL